MHVLLLSDCNKEKLILVSIMVNPCKKLDIHVLNLINCAAINIARDGHALVLYTKQLIKWHFYKNMCGLPVVVTVLFCHNLLLFLAVIIFMKLSLSLSLSISVPLSLHSLLLIYFISVHVVITILYIYMNSCIAVDVVVLTAQCICILILVYLFAFC